MDFFSARRVEEAFQFRSDPFGGAFLLNEFRDDQAVEDQVDEGDEPDVDEAAGDEKGKGISFITNHFGYTE